MLVNQSLDHPVLCSRSAAVTRTSTPLTAAIAPVAEEGEEAGRRRSRVEWETGCGGRGGEGASVYARACASAALISVCGRDDNAHASLHPHHAVSDAAVSQLKRAAAEQDAFFSEREWGEWGGEEVRGDVGEPPISLITSSDWLFGRSAAVNTPVSSSDPWPPGSCGGGAYSAH